MTNTAELRQSMEKLQQDVRDRQRMLRDRPAKRMIIAGWTIAGVAFAAALAIIGWILDEPRMVHMRETINPLVLCVGVAAVLVAAAGHVLLYLRRGQDDQCDGWEEVARGIDPSALGRLASQFQAIETLLPSLRAAIELNQEATLRRLNEIESQRQADLTLMREQGAKLFESIHEHLDRVAVEEIDPDVVHIEDVRMLKRIDDRIKQRRPPVE